MKWVILISLVLALTLGGMFGYWYFKNLYTPKSPPVTVQPLQVNSGGVAESRYAGVAERTAGELTLRHKDGSWTKVFKTANVLPGDVVTTSNLGAAKLTLSSQSRLTLGRQSVLKVTNRAKMFVDLGSVDFVIGADNIAIETQFALLQTSNTNLTIEVVHGKDKITVTQGQLTGQLKSGGDITISSGQTLTLP